MRGATMNFTYTMVSEDCITCGIEFAFPVDFKDRRLEDHRNFYCPNGHTMHYTGKSEAEQLREKLETERKNVEFWRQNSIREQNNANIARRQRDAYKGHTTRLKNRVAKGKCPCCHNEFVNLKAHMTKRHPDFGQDT